MSESDNTATESFDPQNLDVGNFDWQHLSAFFSSIKLYPAVKQKIENLKAAKQRYIDEHFADDPNRVAIKQHLKLAKENSKQLEVIIVEEKEKAATLQVSLNQADQVHAQKIRDAQDFQDNALWRQSNAQQDFDAAYDRKVSDKLSEIYPFDASKTRQTLVKTIVIVLFIALTIFTVHHFWEAGAYAHMMSYATRPSPDTVDTGWRRKSILDYILMVVSPFIIYAIAKYGVFTLIQKYFDRQPNFEPYRKRAEQAVGPRPNFATSAEGIKANQDVIKTTAELTAVQNFDIQALKAQYQNNYLNQNKLVKDAQNKYQTCLDELSQINDQYHTVYADYAKELENGNSYGYRTLNQQLENAQFIADGLKVMIKYLPPQFQSTEKIDQLQEYVQYDRPNTWQDLMKYAHEKLQHEETLAEQKETNATLKQIQQEQLDADAKQQAEMAEQTNLLLKQADEFELQNKLTEQANAELTAQGKELTRQHEFERTAIRRAEFERKQQFIEDVRHHKYMEASMDIMTDNDHLLADSLFSFSRASDYIVENQRY